MTTANAVTVEAMQELLAAFNRHELDAIMTYFADDAVMEMPRDSNP